jgi:hypothetical protein
MIGRRLGTSVTAVVLLASGTYLIVYLYRWEWNRAVVAGVFFLAAELALATNALLRRVRSIEQQLTEASPPALARLRATAPPRHDHFAWLQQSTTRMNVFVPVLLGAGVLLSLLAHLLERVASATTGPMQERRLAGDLGALALPAGGLLPTDTAVGLGALRRFRPERSWRQLAMRAVAMLVALAMTIGAIDFLADRTQDRPDPVQTHSSVDVVMRVDLRFTPRSALRTAKSLFVACRHNLGSVNGTGFAELQPGVIAYTIAPSFGPQAQRRFEGCIEDATFDRISASILSVERID